MNNEQVSKEVKIRLKQVYNLLKEIEEIVRKDKCQCLSPKLDYSCICEVCGKQSISDVLEKPSNQSKGDNESRKCATVQQFDVTCPEKSVKCKDLGEEKMSSVDINETCCSCNRISNKRNHEKNHSKVPNDLLCNISNKQYDNKVQTNCMHESFKNKINDTIQNYMMYFDKINKNASNCSSKINSKKI